jgi:hypothetical protein
MKLLLVFLVFSFYCFSSNAQLLEEGSTTTTEIDTQGGVEEVTETTVTIEHKTTGDVLDGDTGIVTNKYEGDADVDWGGAGSVYSHSSCSDAASGFPATGTDGRTSACGHARTNSLTTWRQYVDLNSFGIEDGGEVNYEFLFAFPNSMYQNSGQTAYVQSKGYNDNVLQWETGLVPIDKTTFTQNPYDYNNNTNWVNTVTGSYDFANQLDKVYIEIGGYGEYYWDEFQYNVMYNHITTVVDTWMQVVQQEQDVTTTIDLMDNYDIDSYNVDPIDSSVDDFTNIDLDMDTTVDVDSVDMPDIDIGMPEISVTTDVGEIFQDLTIDMPLMDVEEVAEVQEIVAEIQEIETMEVSPPQNTELSSNTVSEPVEEISEPSEPPTEVVENTSIEEPTNETENSQESSEAQETEVENKVEEKSDVAENKVENKETESNSEEKVEAEETEEKEIAQKEEPKEEVKEKAKEEPKEEVKEEPKEEKTESEVAEKPSKQQESKQKKANKIMATFNSQYDAVAQMATLALVNALGPNIKTYQATKIQTLPVWYEAEEIYSNVVLPDPLGSYFGVRDSLVFEQMIGAQYE